MNPTLELILAYLARVAPGLALGAAMLILARREPRLRIVVYLAVFILLRDAMTPLSLWSFGTQGFFWMRLHPDPWFLLAFGLSCAGMSLLVWRLDAANRPLVRWTRGNIFVGLAIGVLGAAIVVAPLAALCGSVPLAERGGSVPTEMLPAILAFALLGNLLEEFLFRGYVYGELLQKTTPTKAGLLSGLVFSFCHIFLATTVTDIGWPLLAFTLWEGIIAGLVGSRAGIFASTLTHGGAIFLISSGLL